MAEEQQQRWDTAPLQGTGTMAGARDKKPYFYSNHENCAGDPLPRSYGIFVSKAPRLHPALPAFHRASGPEGTSCKIFPVQTRKRKEGQSPTELCVGGWRQGSRRLPRPTGSLTLPHLRPRKRTGEGHGAKRTIAGSAPARPGRPSVSALPRALRRPGAAARMEEEEEQEGGGGRGAAGGRAASARFVRCLYAVGFLVSHGAREREPAPFQAKGCWLRGASPQLRLGSERQCLQRWWRVAAGLFYPCKQPRCSIHRSDFYPVNAME